MTITDYMVLVGRTPCDLGSKVKDSLRQGWQPIGGVSQETEYFTHNSPNVRFIQAMVKWEATK